MFRLWMKNVGGDGQLSGQEWQGRSSTRPTIFWERSGLLRGLVDQPIGKIGVEEIDGMSELVEVFL